MIFGYWIISLFIRDNALIYEPEWIDYILFPLGILITLVLTKRHFGNFIVGFAIFWIVYLFIKGYIPEWVPVLGSGAGHDTFVQNFNFITQAMWIDTGGIYGAPLQIVSRNVLQLENLPAVRHMRLWQLLPCLALSLVQQFQMLFPQG